MPTPTYGSGRDRRCRGARRTSPLPLFSTLTYLSSPFCLQDTGASGPGFNIFILLRLNRRRASFFRLRLDCLNVDVCCYMPPACCRYWLPLRLRPASTPTACLYAYVLPLRLRSALLIIFIISLSSSSSSLSISCSSGSSIFLLYVIYNFVLLHS